MPGKTPLKFTIKDYVSLVVALSLAFAVWLIHNLSHKYSDVVQCNVLALSDMEGRARTADKAAKLAARCEMEGFSILYYKIFPDHEIVVEFSKNDLVHLGGTRFCIPTANLLSHSHEIFGDGAKCEYFVTDTLFFDFQTVAFKKVPVVLVRRIDFKPQFMATGPIMISPDSVSVYGPDEQLEKITYVNTRPLVLGGVSSDSAGELILDIPEGMRVNTSVVDYHLSVCRYVEESLSLPVTVIGAPAGKNIVVSPSVAQLTLRSVFPKQTDIAGDLKVVVDYADFEKCISGNCIGRLLDLPQSVLSYQISPEIFYCVESAGKQE